MLSKTEPVMVKLALGRCEIPGGVMTTGRETLQGAGGRRVDGRRGLTLVQREEDDLGTF